MHQIHHESRIAESKGLILKDRLREVIDLAVFEREDGGRTEGRLVGAIVQYPKFIEDTALPYIEEDAFTL